MVNVDSDVDPLPAFKGDSPPSVGRKVATSTHRSKVLARLK